MRKRILLGICTLALAFGLVACGNDEEVTYGGHDSAYFQQVAQNCFTSFESLSEDQVSDAMEYYEENGLDILVDTTEGWAELYDEKGEFLGFGEFDLTKSGKTLTATQYGEYTGRNIKLTIVYSTIDIDAGPTAIDFEYVYSMGETMQKAGLNTIMGLVIVFCVLILMCLLIKCFEIIPKIEAAFKKDEDADEAKLAVKAAPKAAPPSNDLELIAVISAAIAASTGASTDSFVVRSIKKRH